VFNYLHMYELLFPESGMILDLDTIDGGVMYSLEVSNFFISCLCLRF
jgi:hypothetical protein